MYNWQYFSPAKKLESRSEKKNCTNQLKELIVERRKPIGWDPTLRQEGKGRFPCLACASGLVAPASRNPADDFLFV